MEVLLLGPIEARLDGRTIPLGAHKQRALLALLALHVNEPVSSERIVEGLWGEEPPASAAKMVQLYVSRLRRLLPGDGAAIVTRSHGYELCLPSDAVDVLRFERLVADHRSREALALWRGDALGDVLGEPFAAMEARRLQELRVRAVEQAIDEDLDAGRHADVLGELELLVGQYPLRERLQAQRMLALYRDGRQAEALEAYRAARGELVERMGVEPGEDLRHLHEAILRQDATLAAPSRPRLAIAARDGRPAPRPSAATGRPRAWLVAAAAVAALALVAFGLTRVLGGDARPPPLGEGVIGAVDVADGTVQAQIVAGRNPTLLAAGGGAIWVGDTVDETITRVDGAGERLVAIDVGRRPTAMAFGGGALWATLEDGDLVRVDPRTNKLGDRRRVGNGPAAIAVGYGAVWIADPVDSAVVRADFERGRPARIIPLGDAPTGVAAGAGAVWAFSERGASVVRIDPRAALPVATIRVGDGARAPAVAGGAVWFATTEEGTVSRIDPGRDVVSDTLTVGRDPAALAGAGNDLWVGHRGAATITRIDAAARRSRETLAVGAVPSTMVVAGSRLWAATQPAPDRHRGGRLRVALAEAAVDPADDISYTSEGSALAGLLYDGLVGYRRVAGAAGATIVARLATAVPRPEDGGRTYRFRLRSGLRFASGTPVRASDVRRSLERELRLAAGWLPRYYDRIVGAPGCRRRPAACRLGGVETDDRARTVTIRLSEADPDMLHKLALPFAAVLQGGGPARVGPHSAPIGTGPYRTQRTTRKRSALLTRNGWFVATDGRPAGFADVIDVRFSPPTDETARLDAALEDRADVALMPRLTAQHDRDRLARVPWRIVRAPTPHTELFFLNTRVAPFDDARVRRAINFAVDRERLARTVGDRGVAEIGCQLLPPGMPARVPRCPWTLDPRPGGGWRAPDLPRARRLVAASGTRGTRVTVHVPPGIRSGAEIAATLRRLGYRATVRGYRQWEAYWPSVGDPRNRVQIGWSGWVSDYLAPAGFLSELVSCAARPPAGFNHSQYCDHRLDRDIASAAAGRRAWGPVVDRIEARALALPLAHGRATTVLGEHVGNVLTHTLNGVMLEQAWVR